MPIQFGAVHLPWPDGGSVTQKSDGERKGKRQLEAAIHVPFSHNPSEGPNTPTGYNRKLAQDIADQNESITSARDAVCRIAGGGFPIGYTQVYPGWMSFNMDGQSGNDAQIMNNLDEIGFQRVTNETPSGGPDRGRGRRR